MCEVVCGLVCVVCEVGIVVCVRGCFGVCCMCEVVCVRWCFWCVVCMK